MQFNTHNSIFSIILGLVLFSIIPGFVLLTIGSLLLGASVLAFELIKWVMKKAFYFLVGLVLVLQLLDLGISYCFIRDGLADESNPVVVELINCIGLFPALFITKILAFLVIYWTVINNIKTHTIKYIIPIGVLNIIYMGIIGYNLSYIAWKKRSFTWQ